MKILGKFLITLLFAVLFSGILQEVKSEESIISEYTFKEIAPDVFLFQDICNVYVLKSGTSAILIDSGSGRIADYLKELGVEKIDWIFHTHYHRDQTKGSLRLKKAGAKIAIGEQEAHLLDTPGQRAPFAFPEKFLLNGELPGWGTRMAPFETPGVDKKLTDGEVFNWNGYSITTLNTPGHTKGSNSFVAEVKNRKFCFTGDLIMSGGHVRDFYSMQWIYLQNPGVDSSLVSLAKIKNLNADVLLPSHGEVMNNPQEHLDLLLARLEKVREAFGYKRAGRWNWSQFVQVSEHVIQDGGSTSQIILSENGEALLFDCGKEFSPERLKEAKAKFGFKRIAVIIPSHWHYDHIDGITEIAGLEGAEVWVWEGLAEHLEHPERFPTTCWTGKSIGIDRILKEEETFSWGGYTFKVFHHPVHTRQQMGLLAKADGLDFYLVADGLGYTKDGKLRSPIHCYNGLSLSTAIIKTAQSFVKASPYICLPAHSNVFAVSPNDKYEFLDWSIETTDAIRSLLPPPDQNLGFDPYWASFYPVRTKMKAGQQTKIVLRVKNDTGKTVSGRFKVTGYGDVVFENEGFDYELNPGETKDFPVRVKSKKSAGKGIHIVTADIEFDGNVFGEYPQAYIELDE